MFCYSDSKNQNKHNQSCTKRYLVNITFTATCVNMFIFCFFDVQVSEQFSTYLDVVNIKYNKSYNNDNHHHYHNIILVIIKITISLIVIGLKVVIGQFKKPITFKVVVYINQSRFQSDIKQFASRLSVF